MIADWAWGDIRDPVLVQQPVSGGPVGGWCADPSGLLALDYQ